MPGESQIVAMIRALARDQRDPSVQIGIGDDAAVLAIKPGQDLLFCSDLSIEGVHFRTEWTGLDLIGRKALAVTISDIAAMGGEPKFALASVAMTPGTSEGAIRQLFCGMFDLAAEAAFSLVGGDTSRSPGPLFIDTSAIGVCGHGRAISRSGARPGDLVYVTGELGGSAMGLALLQEGFRLGDTGDSTDLIGKARQAAIRRHLLPIPRVNAGCWIASEGLASAMIDISDGFATDLDHITRESKCGAVIHADQLPIAQAVRDLASMASEIDPISLALESGEEYELLFSSPSRQADRIRDLSERLELPITRIGEIISEPCLLVERNGRTKIMAATGFEHEI